MSAAAVPMTPSRLRSSASVPSFRSPTHGSHLPASSSTPLSSMTQHATSESPKRPATPSEYLSSPIKHPANAHPYAIHSSSTSILTRTNSSPAEGTEPARYRPSRSMSSLHYVMEASNIPSGDIKKTDEGVAVRRRRTGLKKCLSIPSFTFDKEVRPDERPDLPTNPKSWTPNDLATYLAWTLRSGGTNGSGETLPERLVDDIKSWIYRHRIFGRDFLDIKSEVWSTARRPPFLSLLLTLSRKLRRQSIQGTSFHRGEPSVFQEEEEEEPLDSTKASLIGVKGLAKTYETIPNADGTGHRRDARPLEPQWIGSSTSSAVSERWGLRHYLTGTSIRSSSPTEDAESHHYHEDSDSQGAVTNAITLQLATVSQQNQKLGKSPPPPHASPFLHSGTMGAIDVDHPASPPKETTLVINAGLAGNASTPRAFSAEPEQPSGLDYVPGFGRHSGKDHVGNQRRSNQTLSASDQLPPNLDATPANDDHVEEDEDAEGSGTARRVTLRPLPSKRSKSVRGLFSQPGSDPEANDFGPNWRRGTVRETTDAIEGKLDEICRRLSYLERNLPPIDTPQCSTWDTWMAWNGLRGFDGLHGIIKGLREGPVVAVTGVAGLFLFTGIGLGMLAGGVMSRRR